jgi:hypothetical protein
MSRRPIAPVLTALLDELRAKTIRYPLSREDSGDLQVIRVAREELQRVTAVVRAVRREGAPTCQCGPCRALVRLDRLSALPRRKT